MGCTLCVLSIKTIRSDSFFECVISHGMTLALLKVFFLVLQKSLIIESREKYRKDEFSEKVNA